MSSFVEILIFLPIVGALIGYVCKLMAIKMLFHPAKWMGIGPLGWQGVVQRRSPKFAGGVADTVMTAGVRVDAMLAKVDAASIAETLGPLLEAAAPGALEAAIEAVKPGAYAALPAPVKAQLAGQVGVEGKRITKVLIEELRPLVPELVDVRQLIIRQLSGDNADKLARLFQEVGKRELQVVIWYGAVLGFIIGLVEVGFYAALERWWLLPMIGAIDGLVNNWLAIQMIFRPLEKKRYLGIFPFQGLFPARQDEISRDYGRMLANEVLTPRDFLAHVDPASRARLEAAAKAIVEREAAPLMQMMAMMLGTPARSGGQGSRAGRGDVVGGGGPAGARAGDRGRDLAPARGRQDARGGPGGHAEGGVRGGAARRVRGGRVDPGHARRRAGRRDRHAAGRDRPRAAVAVEYRSRARRWAAMSARASLLAPLLLVACGHAVSPASPPRRRRRPRRRRPRRSSSSRSARACGCTGPPTRTSRPTAWSSRPRTTARCWSTPAGATPTAWRCSRPCTIGSGGTVTDAIVTHSHGDRVGGVRALVARGVHVHAGTATAAAMVAEGLPAPDDVAASPAARSIGGVDVEIFFPGAGHTRDNVVVWLPATRIVFGGCFVKSPAATDLGNIADADLAAWPASIATVRARYPQAVIIVPGHGPIAGDDPAIDGLRAHRGAARCALITIPCCRPFSVVASPMWATAIVSPATTPRVVPPVWLQPSLARPPIEIS